jgi:hypothetical protein
MNIWFPTVYNRICTEYFLINAIYCNITTQIIFRKKTKLKICTFYETGNKQREKLFMLQIWQERYGNMCNSSIKTLISNLLHTARFWDNLHQVRSISKYWKAKKFKCVWETFKPCENLLQTRTIPCLDVFSTIIYLDHHGSIYT